MVDLKTRIKCLNFETVIKTRKIIWDLETVHSHERMFTEAYLGTYRISAMEVFCKWLTAVNHFRKKKLHCRLLTESSMRLWLYITLIFYVSINTEAATRRFSVGKLFLKISQNSQKNNCARVSFLIKFQAKALQLY